MCYYELLDIAEAIRNIDAGSYFYSLLQYQYNNASYLNTSLQGSYKMHVALLSLYVQD